MTATRQRIALIPIDVQRGFDYSPWGRRNNPDMEANGRRLLAAWRERGWPLIHVRHDSVQPGSSLSPGHPGNAFRDGFEPRPDEAVVAKSVNAAFIGTDLDLRLRRLGVDTVVLFGVSTDMCVSTTARMASNLGYRTVVIGDACFCFDLDDGAGATIAAEAISAAHLATLRAEFAQVLDTAEFLATLDAV
ncbi:cysteine hydrolase family protein [Lysobacter yananisis]|uniref:Cysteine hydrolase family protein n=1 Tax=Lysobacter yananisis TaxID=1003114 RepID=A0ABY9PFG8_9GAMM|nr:cysteine hydrolase family protein [Lysobacter yananisis]WMT05124.1 cysteine hydrolase family protein [Lysobacter yananisis]